jgi:hypothetical protein
MARKAQKTIHPQERTAVIPTTQTPCGCAASHNRVARPCLSPQSLPLEPQAEGTLRNISRTDPSKANCFDRPSDSKSNARHSLYPSEKVPRHLVTQKNSSKAISTRKRKDVLSSTEQISSLYLCNLGALIMRSKNLCEYTQ